MRPAASGYELYVEVCFVIGPVGCSDETDKYSYVTMRPEPQDAKP